RHGAGDVAESEPPGAALRVDVGALALDVSLAYRHRSRGRSPGYHDPTLRGLMNAYASVPAAYKESSVLTAPPERLVVMLYDGANRFLTQAAAAMREGDF